MSTARNGLQTTPPASPPPLIESLRHQIRKLETAGRADDVKTISSGCRQLDQCLPDHGLVTGTITEWFAAAGGWGGELLSLLAAREACRDGGALVIVDTGHTFYPAAAAAWGIDLQNVVLLRGSAADRSTVTAGAMPSSLLWAIDQALRCPAVAAVWGHLGAVSERWQRRFQLSAEQSGSMGMFIRPSRLQDQPGWSDVQLEVQPLRHDLPSRPAAVGVSHDSQPAFDRQIHLRVLRVRNGTLPRHPLTLQVDFTTGKVQAVTRTHEHTHRRTSESAATLQPSPHTVRLASQLAHPKTGGRRQRA